MSELPDELAWERLAPWALVFLVLKGMQRFVRENLVLFVGAGAGAAFTDWLGVRELMLAGLIVLSMIIASAVIYHRRFQFRLDANAVRLRQGLFERKELRVRFSRVQNVQLGQPFYFRPFDLVRFSLETPGGVQTEVELPGIPRALAEEMRDRILGARSAQASLDPSVSREDAAVGLDHVLFEPSTARLFLHGMTSNQIWVLAGVLLYVFDLLFRNVAEQRLVAALVDWFDARIVAGWLAPVALAGAILLLLFVISGALAVIRFHRYQLHDHGARLVGIGGLLDKREQTLRRDKITGLMLRQSPLGRLLGSWVLVARQARGGEWEPDGGGQDRFLLPGLRTQNLEICGSLIAGATLPSQLLAIDGGYRRVLWLRWLLVAGALLVVLIATAGRQHAAVYLTLLALPVLLAGVHLRWRHWGWHLQGRQLWVRRGLLGQRMDVFDIEQVQHVSVTQSPYQRRHDLATLQMTLPQGAVSVPFLPLETAARLANITLYAAETAMQHRV